MTRKPKTKRSKRRATAQAAPKAVTGSVVPAKYRDKYQDGSCGDDIAVKLKQHCSAADGTIDLAKLKAIAEANQVWRAEYSQLNAGLVRMSTSSRLRALVRKGGTIKWSVK